MATDAAGVALWSWYVDTDEIALDERAHQMWGVPASEGRVTFESLSARIHPEDLDRVGAAFASTRKIFGAYETGFRVSDKESVRWISARGQGDDQGIVGRIMFGIVLDVSERKTVEQEPEMIANEMSHRISNLFATIAALARISARATLTPAAMADDITRRLAALSKAKDLVRPSRAHPNGAIDLGAPLTALLSAYDDTGANGEHIRVSVPQFLVGETSVTTLALIIHELATNSLKYGALSSASGTLAVLGTIDGDQLTIV
jgi:two-component sensor histidine kinase